MQNLNDLYYFVKAVDFAGFAPAGRALGIPKSKFSRRVAALEQSLGVRLVNRSTRRFSLTPVGERYYEHCRAMLIEAEAAQEAIDLTKSEPQGTIRITCPIGLLNFHVGELLAKFMARCPKIRVELEATNRRVDVVGEGIDVAIRVRPLPIEDSDLNLRTLSDRGQCLVASPDLIEQFGMPTLPESLHQWPSLSRAVPQEHHVWRLTNSNGEQVEVKHRPRYITTDMLALKSAAIHGVGLVQLPVLMLQEELASEKLVSVLPDWTLPREVIHLVFASRRGMLPAVREFIDFLVEFYSTFEED
ncbi:MAG: LysR family transcriptional regulator [Pseudohongiellaceae bacterium]|jgi:DNA-binding transcriptional LysR family regulator